MATPPRTGCRLQLNRRLNHFRARLLQLNRRLIAGRLIAPYPLNFFSVSISASALQLVDENPFIVSLLGQPARPAGRASAWRAESTPRGAPQGVRETRCQTDTNPSDPRSEDRGSGRTAGIAHPADTWPRKRPLSTDWPSVANWGSTIIRT